MWGGREKRAGRKSKTEKQRNSNMRPKTPFEPEIFSVPLHFF